MYYKSLVAALFLSSTFVTPKPVYAGNDFVKGVIVGGAAVIIGKKLLDKKRKKKKKKSYSNYSGNSGGSSSNNTARNEERARVRDIQTRLAQQGFDPGGIDGKMGGNTRRAIREFQAGMGNPETGELTPQQYQMLVQMGSSTNDGGGQDVEILDPAPDFATTTPGETLPSEQNALPESQIGDNITPASLGGGGSILGTPEAEEEDEITPSEQEAEQRARDDNARMVRAIVDETDFSVYGIRLFQGKSTALQMLNDGGIENCDVMDSSISCKTITAQYEEKLLLGYSATNDGNQIHTITRSMNFKKAYKREAILGQFESKYQPLVNAEGNQIASSSACKNIAGQVVHDEVSGLQPWVETSSAPNAQVTALAATCNFYYSLKVPEEEMVDQVELILFTGQPIMSSVFSGGNEQQSTEGDAPTIRF